MDLMAELHRINHTDEAIRARRARKAARTTMVYDRLAQAVGRPSAQRPSGAEPLLDEFRDREAASKWNMFPEDEGYLGTSLGEQHPGAAALLVVRNALSEYDLPTKVDLRYHGMHRTSGHGAYAMDEGIVMVQADFASMAGAKHSVEIPVVVKSGRMLDPSVLIHNGVKRIITQHTFDDIIGMGEFKQRVPDRLTMFSPPPGKDAKPAQRQVPIVNPGMYSVLPRRMTTGQKRAAIQAAVSGQRTAADPLHEPELPQVPQLKMKLQKLEQQLAQTRDPGIQAKIKQEIQRLRYDLENATGEYNLSLDDPDFLQGYTDRLRHLQPGQRRMSRRTAAMLAKLAMDEAPEDVAYFEALFKKPVKAWGPNEWKEFYRRYKPEQHKVIPAGRPESPGLFGKLRDIFNPPDIEASVDGHACMAGRRTARDPYEDDAWADTGDTAWGPEVEVEPEPEWSDAGGAAWGGEEVPSHPDHLEEEWAYPGEPGALPAMRDESPNLAEEWDPGSLAYQFMREHPDFDWSEASMPLAYEYAERHGLEVSDFLDALNTAEYAPGPGHTTTFEHSPEEMGPSAYDTMRYLHPLDDPEAAKQAGRALTGRVVQGFYEPTVTGGPTGPLGRDVPGADGSFLDPAERMHENRLWPSAPVRAKNEIEVRGREGQRFRIPRGEVGEVVRDVDGTNRAYYVRWVDLGYACTVGRQNLRLVG